MRQKLFKRSLEQHHSEDIKYHLFGDPHRRASGLSDIILGGQDGLVNVLGVILGVAAATHDPRIVLVAGLAAIPVLLLPGLAYRMSVEEKLLRDEFGDEYQRYIRQTKKLLPGLW
jgi:hypothetical protein